MAPASAPSSSASSAACNSDNAARAMVVVNSRGFDQLDLRSAIVDMVEQMHATPEQREQCEGYYGKPVQGWAREMRKPGTPGDEICIEYFARHFKLSFRVYSPVLKRPLQFPTYLDMGGEISSGQQPALSGVSAAQSRLQPPP